MSVYDYFNYSIHFHCSLKYFLNLLKTARKNRTNVQAKEN